MDGAKFEEEARKLAESFLSARQETEQLVAKHELELCAFLQN